MRLAAYLAETRPKTTTARCVSCGTMHSINVGTLTECGSCLRARNENDAVSARVVDVRLVRLRDGNWHVSVDGELVGEARGPGSALMQVRDWLLEGHR